jgi:hypothetical protein
VRPAWRIRVKLSVDMLVIALTLTPPIDPLMTVLSAPGDVRMRDALRYEG